MLVWLLNISRIDEHLVRNKQTKSALYNIFLNPASVTVMYCQHAVSTMHATCRTSGRI